MPNYVDDRFRVTVIRDRRGGNYRKDGAHGTCLGPYMYPHIDRPMLTEPFKVGEESLCPRAKSLIVLDDGSHIWAGQCWWTDSIIEDKSLESAQKLVDNIDASMHRENMEELERQRAAHSSRQ